MIPAIRQPELAFIRQKTVRTETLALSTHAVIDMDVFTLLSTVPTRILAQTTAATRSRENAFTPQKIVLTAICALSTPAITGEDAFTTPLRAKNGKLATPQLGNA